MDVAAGRPDGDETPEMRHEGHIAVPGEQRPVAAADRQADEARIIEEHRLDHRGAGRRRRLL